MLHIGKTGGSAVKHALRPVAPSLGLTLHPHEIRLTDIPVDEPIFFFLRDPLSRFVSGFNSRLRKGAPRNYSEWRPGERDVFSRFQTANALAEAIFTPDGDAAMRTIYHVRDHYTDWLVDFDYLVSREVLMIGWQETLSADFARLAKLLGVQDIELPLDPVVAHVTPTGFDTGLSALAEANLRSWYAADIDLVAAIRAHQASGQRSSMIAVRGSCKKTAAR